MTAKESILISDMSLSLLDESFDLLEFNCGRDDINEFLKDDALNYQKQKLANTFIFHPKDKKNPVAFFSILNDALNVKNLPNNEKNKFNRRLPNNKRINHYPAIKIGRLGVTLSLQKSGFAYSLMDFIKGFSVKNLNSACRLLILDAVNEPKQISYYQKNDFTFLMESDKESKTRLMYFDLISFN
jgi:hypothetical protein